jgi:hypothetical protein
LKGSLKSSSLRRFALTASATNSSGALSSSAGGCFKEEAVPGSDKVMRGEVEEEVAGGGGGGGMVEGPPKE